MNFNFTLKKINLLEFLKQIKSPLLNQFKSFNKINITLDNIKQHPRLKFS